MIRLAGCVWRLRGCSGKEALGGSEMVAPLHLPLPLLAVDRPGSVDHSRTPERAPNKQELLSIVFHLDYC